MTFFRQLIIVCVVALICWASDVRAGIVNGSFDTGGFTGWEQLASTSIVTSGFGVTPTSGDYQAFLSTAGTSSTASVEGFLGVPSGTLNSLVAGTATTGSAIRQSITGQAGDVLSFDWNFLTNENLPSSFNDFAFWSLSNQQDGELLADTLFSPFVASSSPFASETGYQTTTFTLTQSGTFILGFGVMDVQDELVVSGLLIDNVQLTSSTSPIPEPSSLVIFGLASMGLVYLRRRR